MTRLLSPTKTRLALVPDLADAELPLSIRLTMEDVLDTAVDADLRADILASVFSRNSSGPGATQRANRLNEVAHALRIIAQHMGDGLTATPEVSLADRIRRTIDVVDAGDGVRNQPPLWRSVGGGAGARGSVLLLCGHETCELRAHVVDR